MVVLYLISIELHDCVITFLSETYLEGYHSREKNKKANLYFYNILKALEVVKTVFVVSF